MVDNLIAETRGRKDWSKWRENAEAFIKRFEELKIDGDPLVEDHSLCQFRYLPLSIYMLVSMNDTAVSNAYYVTYSNRIHKEFVNAVGDTCNYLHTFYEAISWGNSYAITDNMLGAIFHLKDLSFFKRVAAEHRGGSGKSKAVQWLQFLDDQIGHYMKEGEEKELFHKEIKAELQKAKDSLYKHKKADVLLTMDSLFSKLSEIDDPMFREEVKKKFLTKMEKRDEHK